MKKNILVFFILLSSLSSCFAQLVKTTNDVGLISENKSTFLDKPLSKLLGEIKPDFKLFMAEEKTGNESLAYISFYFVSYDRFAELVKSGKKPTKVMVFLEGKVTGNDYSLPINQRFLWTKNYKEHNKDLIVKRILITKGED